MKIQQHQITRIVPLNDKTRCSDSDYTKSPDIGSNFPSTIENSKSFCTVLSPDDKEPSDNDDPKCHDDPR